MQDDVEEVGWEQVAFWLAQSDVVSDVSGVCFVAEDVEDIKGEENYLSVHDQKDPPSNTEPKTYKHKDCPQDEIAEVDQVEWVEESQAEE